VPPDASDTDLFEDAVDTAKDLALGKQLVANVEYRTGEKQWVISLFDQAERTGINAALLRAGVVRVENRRERRYASMLNKLRESEQHAKDNNFGLWYWGDIDYDEPKEPAGADSKGKKPKGKEEK
jgi:hypothetical protein